MPASSTFVLAGFVRPPLGFPWRAALAVSIGMDGFLYYRVKRPAIQQFARLAINSNDQHPAHHRDATQLPHTAASPVTPSQLHSTLLSILSSASTSSNPLPPPLIELILDYALCSSLVAAEADGAMHDYELVQPEGSQARHWRATHGDALTAVTSLPDGLHCATGSHDGLIVIARHSAAGADSETGRWREVRRIEHKHAIHALQGVMAVDPLQPALDSSSDSHIAKPPSLIAAVVVGSSAGLFVYSPSTGRMLHELSGHTSRVSALCVLPGSSQSASVVVSASWDGSCRLWSLLEPRCECVLRGRGKSLTCVAAVNRGCVVAGDVTGGVMLWQLAAARRANIAAVPLSHPSPPPVVASSIASIQLAGHTSSSAYYVFRSPDTPSAPPVDVPSVPPSSHFSASSAATRSVLSGPSKEMLLWVGGDDGLRLFAPSENEEWRCLRRIVTPSPRGSSYLPVHSLLWLSSCRMAVGMSKKLEVWDCQPLLEAADVDSAERVQCEWTEMAHVTSVRSLTVRHWLDITQPLLPPASAVARSGIEDGCVESR